MSSGSALRYLLVAVAAIAVWKIAYETGRVTPAAMAAAKASGPLSPKPSTRDAWQDIVRRSNPKQTARVLPPNDPSALPDGPFARNVAELERRAEAGDAGAAYALAKGFRGCRFYTPPKDQADLRQRAEDRAVNALSINDQLVELVKQRAQQTGVAEPVIPKADSMQVYNEKLKSETALDENCRGVARGDVDRWLSWYAKAASLGDPDAQVSYWRAAFDQADMTTFEDLERVKSDVAQDLQQALSRGDWRALVAIGQVFSQGYYTDPDPFMAHAYFFAAAQAPSADIAYLPWMQSGGFVSLFSGGTTQTFISHWLTSTGAALDADQLAQSERLGAGIYSQCCAGKR